MLLLNCTLSDASCVNNSNSSKYHFFLVFRVKSYVPSRSVFPSWEGGVEHAVSQFQDHTATLASQLVQEYRDLCGGQDGGGAEESSEEK